MMAHVTNDMKNTRCLLLSEKARNTPAYRVSCVCEQDVHNVSVYVVYGQVYRMSPGPVGAGAKRPGGAGGGRSEEVFPQHSQRGRQRGRGQACLGRGFLWGESLECSVMSAPLWRGGGPPPSERTAMLLGDTGVRGGWQPPWCSWAERSHRVCNCPLLRRTTTRATAKRGRGRSWGEAAPGPWEEEVLASTTSTCAKTPECLQAPWSPENRHQQIQTPVCPPLPLA